MIGRRKLLNFLCRKHLLDSADGDEINDGVVWMGMAL